MVTRLRILCAWGCYALGWVFVGVVGLLLGKGGIWAYGFYAEAPMENVGLAVLFFFLGYLISRGYRNRPRDWVRVAGKCMLLTISTVVSIAAAEGALRVILADRVGDNSLERLSRLRAEGREIPVKSETPLVYIIDPVPDPELVYQLRPHLRTNFGHRLLVTNRDGIRSDRNYDVEKPPGMVRILGLGDSGMFGWGVEQRENYMAVLDGLLNPDGQEPAFEVINTGTPGYNTALEVAAYKKRWRPYRPDIVVLGWCNNDWYLPHFMLEKVDFSRRDLSFLYLLCFQRDAFRELVYGYRITDRSTMDEHDVTGTLIGGTEADGVREALAELREMTEADGAKLLVFGPMKPDIETICRDLGLTYLNTVAAIESTPEHEAWGVHHMHPRAPGHALLGWHLYREFRNRGWIDLPPLDPDQPDLRPVGSPVVPGTDG